jgi:Zn-dependent M28 family amino/carboxypeptidase
MLSPDILTNDQEKKEIIVNSKKIINSLAVDIGERTIGRYENLVRAGDFIKDYFSQYGHEPREESYTVNSKKVCNIITEIKGYERPEKTIILGAHYDTVEGTPGADDNASAVAGLLEIYRLASKYKFKKTIRFVSFTLEEPPFFQTDEMGSMVHAKGCRSRKEKIELMICLEMIGFGSKKCLQRFPNDEYRKKYPQYGDYLAVAGTPSMSEYVYAWKKKYNFHAKHKIFDLIAPASVRGIDLSDHSSFIKNGIPAIMISDTGYYRNLNYHQKTDTADTINHEFLYHNIKNSFLALRDFLNSSDIFAEERNGM